MNPTRHIAKTLSALCASLWIGIAGAQANYPDKPITVIVPFPPGVVDGYARLVATKAGTLLGQPMVIRNQAGAGQRIGTDAMAKAPKDGYTIGVITNAGVVSGPVLAQSVPYDPVKDLHVPYRGESPLTTDLIGGQVDFAFSSMANRSLAEQGKLVMLAYTGDKRSPLIPNVPTVKELGIPHVSSGWLGFAVPAGVPAPIREKLIAALTSAVNDPEVVANFTKGGGEPCNLSGDAFAARVKREIDELREKNKDLKLSIE